MILGWAIPAAIVGGPEFAHMIFWKQSAGRMVEAFHHRQPIWFYLPVLAGFLLPLFFWRPLWRALAKARREPLSRPVRFLLCWLGPTFVAFCLISGKQPHYMLPLMPGVAIIAASLLGRGQMCAAATRGSSAMPFAVLFLVLTLGPSIAAWAGLDSPNGFVSKGLGAFHPLLSLAAGALALAPAAPRAGPAQPGACDRGVERAPLRDGRRSMPAASLFRLYDLAPLGEGARRPTSKGRSPSLTNTRASSVSWRASRTPWRPSTATSSRPGWRRIPTGTAILRHNSTENPEAGTVVYAQPFRPNKTFSVMRAKPE